jgi:hypothetical protein
MNDNSYLHMPHTSNQTYAKDAHEKRQATEKLVKVIGDAHDVLVRATTVFPLTLFPDTLTVDRTKLTITHRDFFNSAEVLSITVEDLLNITANVGPFFGSIKISTRFFDPDKPYTVDHFWRADALKIKRIVQGYIIARKKNVDCSALPTAELAKTLDELGKVAPEEKV